MDYLSQTDETLENRKSTFLLAIIEEIKKSLMFDKGRKFAPTIHALKDKLNAIKKLDFQSRKISDFNLEQAEIISARIQKITTHFANHLKMTIPWWMIRVD
jgi:glutamyl-tRNA reductase